MYNKKFFQNQKKLQQIFQWIIIGCLHLSLSCTQNKFKKNNMIDGPASDESKRGLAEKEEQLSGEDDGEEDDELDETKSSKKHLRTVLHPATTIADILTNFKSFQKKIEGNTLNVEEKKNLVSGIINQIKEILGKNHLQSRYKDDIDALFASLNNLENEMMNIPDKERNALKQRKNILDRIKQHLELITTDTSNYIIKKDSIKKEISKVIKLGVLEKVHRKVQLIRDVSDLEAILKRFDELKKAIEDTKVSIEIKNQIIQELVQKIIDLVERNVKRKKTGKDQSDFERLKENLFLLKEFFTSIPSGMKGSPAERISLIDQIQEHLKSFLENPNEYAEKTPKIELIGRLKRIALSKENKELEILSRIHGLTTLEVLKEFFVECMKAIESNKTKVQEKNQFVTNLVEKIKEFVNKEHPKSEKQEAKVILFDSLDFYLNTFVAISIDSKKQVINRITLLEKMKRDLDLFMKDYDQYVDEKRKIQ